VRRTPRARWTDSRTRQVNPKRDSSAWTNTRSFRVDAAPARDATILVTITSSRTPVLEGRWIEPGAHVNAAGSNALDAASLLLPLIRFVSPTDPRWLSTLGAIEQDLVSDSLVYRYRLSDRFSDGLTGQEGTFSMCSFWYVECLSRMGDLHKARFFFEKMLGYANHLGLYGEELGPQAQHLGNFPQAFTHLALISAAFDLDRRLSAAGHAG